MHFLSGLITQSATLFNVQPSFEIDIPSEGPTFDQKYWLSPKLKTPQGSETLVVPAGNETRRWLSPHERNENRCGISPTQNTKDAQTEALDNLILLAFEVMDYAFDHDNLHTVRDGWKMKQRPGTSSVEYVVITGLISLACLSVVIVMHESNALTSVSDSLAFDENLKEMQQSPERRPADQPELGAAYSPQLVVINALCVLALGLVFIRRSREKRTKKQPVVCKVERIQQHSKALNVVLGKRSRVKSIVQEEWVDLLEGRASVGTYMSRELEVVSPHLKIEEADQKLRANGFRRVIVMHEDGRLAGVLSRKDIASKEGRVVADIMTSTPKTASPDMSLRIAQSILLQHRISCLPVVDNNQLVGVLSTSDLLIVLQCLLLILSNQNESDSFASATELVQPNVRSKALC